VVGRRDPAPGEYAAILAVLEMLERRAETVAYRREHPDRIEELNILLAIIQ
jgi:hypothetical protein